jgi:hypothetical protein
LDTKHLPPYLRKPLLINPTVAKAAHNAALKSEWQNEWRNSKQGKVITEIDKLTPSSKFLKTISKPQALRVRGHQDHADQICTSHSMGISKEFVRLTALDVPHVE